MKTKLLQFVNDHSILLPGAIGVGSVLGLYLFLVICKLIMVFGLSGAYFDGLPSVEIMRAFGVSFTYDTYVIACFLLPLIVLLFIPMKGKWFLKTLATFIVFVLDALFFFTIGDILFFSLFFTEFFFNLIQFNLIGNIQFIFQDHCKSSFTKNALPDNIFFFAD